MRCVVFIHLLRVAENQSALNEVKTTLILIEIEIKLYIYIYPVDLHCADLPFKNVEYKIKCFN